MRFLKSISAATPLRRMAAVIAFAMLPGLAAAQACPDIGGPTITPLNFNASQLAQPQFIPLTAGGDINLANCQAVDGYGYVVGGPDFELALSGVAPGSQLKINVTGDCDTVLLANNFDGSWHFNDDGPAGLNPELILPAVDGVYDIWVGTYDAATCGAQFSLQVGQNLGGQTTTTPPPPSICPDPAMGGAPLTYSAGDLAAGQRIPVVAGGDINLTTCPQVQGVGHVVAPPDFALTVTGATPGAMLTIGIEAQCDAVLLVNDTAGGWQFNDDTNGTNPAVTIPAANGIYNIWAGTYDTQFCESEVVLSMTGGAATTPDPNGGKPTGTTDNTTPTPDPVAVALPDPGNLAGFRERVGETIAFTVTGSASGSVWGTGIYTDDTRLAAAAVHAGVLQPGQTGTVNVLILGPQDSFTGSPANGVTSSNYGSWGGSYSVMP